MATFWLPDEVKAPGASLSLLDGMTVERMETFEVPNVAFPQIFRTERYSMSAYEFNLPNGKYTVRLHFAETFTGITSWRAPRKLCQCELESIR